MDSLMVLELSRNQISSLNYLSIPNLKSLIKLNASYNKLPVE